MRIISAALVLSAAVLGGCAMSPRPARTQVTPGESEFSSEREERRPVESKLRIKASTPPAPVPPVPSLRVRVTLPERQPDAPVDPK